MPTTFLAPDPIQSTQFIPGGNTPANGGQLFFYLAGTSTKTTVYKDNAGATAWSNPIVLDSGGNLPSGGEVWFTSGQSVKVIFAPSTDGDPPTSPYWTKDNLSGINDVSAQTGNDWVASATPTFVSVSSFTMVGDQTAVGTADVGRQMKLTVTAGTAYGWIASRSFATGSTTVNLVTVAGTVLDSGLSAGFYGLSGSVHPSVPLLNGGQSWFIDPTDRTKTVTIHASSVPTSTTVFMPFTAAGLQDIAAATTAASTSVNLNNVTGHHVPIVNSTTLTQYVLSQGALRSIEYNTSMVLVNGTTLTLGATISTSAGDTHLLRGSSSGVVKTLSYWPPPAGVGASMTLLEAKTAASTALMTFTTISSAFDNYLVFIDDAQGTANAAAMILRVSIDGGATYVSTGAQYQTAFTGFDAGGNTRTVAGSAQNAIFLSETTNAILNSQPFSANLVLYSPASSGFERNFIGQSVYQQNGSGSVISGRFAGAYTSAASPVNAVAFLFNSGNVSSGRFYLYGCKRA